MIRKLTPRNKKWFRFVIIGGGFLLSIFIFFNWWFERNAVTLIKAIVERESHGQYKIDISRLRIHYFHPPRIELFNTQLHVYDSTGKILLYDINVAHLGLQGKSLRNLVFGKKMLVDYIVVEAPGINIHSQHKAESKNSPSISRQIGNITIFLQKLANMLEVKSLKITNGSLGLHDLPPYNQTIQLNDINFLVNNFHSEGGRGTDDTAFLFSDNIALETGRQDIEFPDKRHTLKFASLEISTQNKNIDILDASLSGKSADTTLSYFKIDIKRLHLINTDFNMLYNSDRIKVDSIYCHEPKVDFFLDASQKKTNSASDTTAEQLIKQLVGDMDIKYVGFLNSSINVTTKTAGGQSHYSTNDANLEFFGVAIKSNEYQTSLVDRVNLSIKNYHALSADSLYDIFLDSVTIADKNLFLKNLRLMPSDRNTNKTRRTIIVPTLELRNISFYNLVFNKKLTATELILRDPSFTDFYTEKKVSDNNTGQSFGQILTGISRRAQVDQLIIMNGSLLSQSANIKSRKVEVIGMFMSIATKQLLADTSFENLQQSVSNVVFSRAIFTFPKSQFELTNGIFMGEKKMLTAETVRGVTEDKNFMLSADSLKLFGYHVTKEFDKFSVDSVQWSKANIQFHQKNQEKNKKDPEKQKAMDVFVKFMSVKNTHVDIDLPDGAIVKTDLQNLSFQNFNMTPDRKVVLSGLVLDGKYVQVNKPGLQLKLGEFSVHENQDSHINNLEIDYDQKGRVIKGRIPRMDMAFNLSELLRNGNLLVSRLDLQKPELAVQITAEDQGTQSTGNSARQRIVEIENLNFNEAKVDFLSQRGQLKTAFGTANATIKLTGLTAGEGPFTLKNFDIRMKGYNINNHDSLRLYSENGEFILRGSNLVKGTKKDPNSFKVHIAEAELVDANTEFRRKTSSDPILLEKINLGLKDLQIDTLESHHIGQRLKSNPYLFIRNINIIQKDEKNDMAIHGLAYVNGGHIVSLDSFHYHPSVDKETFNKGLAHEKDYIETTTGHVRISQVDIEKLIADSLFSASKIEIDNPWLSVYKDKHNPFDSSKYKPLPVNLLKKIKFGLDVDSLKLNDLTIEYTEWNDKTHKVAGFDFKHTNATISNINNRDFKPNDSLVLVAYSRFLDTSNILLHFEESYTDSLAAFYMSVRVSPFPLKTLNRFLPAIASAEIENGELDTMRIRAIGREHLALGYMQFYYHDLKVRFLDKGNPVRKTFKTRIVTFLANNVLLRKKNDNRIGRIYAERVTYRGIFNYWIKILLSGAMTSTGVKANDHQVKKYEKEMKKYKVPEIADVNF